MNELFELLNKNQLTIGSVESLTAGLFASNLASIPGASKVLKGSLVTYSSELKEKLAYVNKNDIKKHGVVSDIVAKEMAIGGLKALNVDICISCTGNAGPSTCLGDAPVGRVYIAFAYKNCLVSKELNLVGNRNDIRNQTVIEMNKLIIKEIGQLF